ncbi:helix-turn-helix transcriptional regulator [Nocardia sp. alder85J]|uniref:helix-turn-helix transcriptional regulator n=1 Tax=Nocardia sp. alder85J TaxID=2862949 RepID=UPI001CD65975|nr:WYL domain-containing protein [Nocardia sp. alder85J]MCX4095164.1 WYL domain-containing protein [Nocardia sp. alder85J]
MNTTGRRLEMVTLLQARPGISASELARRLGVTERTARRDIGQLRELGYRIDAAPGRGGGYRLARGASIPALMLDGDELLAVVLGLRTAAGIGDIATAAATALAKIATIVPARMQQRLNALAEIGHADETRRIVDGAVLVALALACRQREAVRIRRRVDDRARTLQPLQLVHLGGMWYLVACERDSPAWRTWALDRIDTVEPIGRSLPTPLPPEDPVGFVTRSLARGRRHAVRLRVDAPVEVVRAWVPPSVAEAVGDGDGCELRLATDDIAAAARWVMSLGPEVEVVEPDELRAQLAVFGSALVERYGRA